MDPPGSFYGKLQRNQFKDAFDYAMEVRAENIQNNYLIAIVSKMSSTSITSIEELKKHFGGSPEEAGVAARGEQPPTTEQPINHKTQDSTSGSQSDASLRTALGVDNWPRHIKTSPFFYGINEVTTLDESVESRCTMNDSNAHPLEHLILNKEIIMNLPDTGIRTESFETYSTLGMAGGQPEKFEVTRDGRNLFVKHNKTRWGGGTYQTTLKGYSISIENFDKLTYPGPGVWAG